MPTYSEMRDRIAQMRSNPAESAIYDIIRAVFRTKYDVYADIFDNVVTIRSPLLTSNGINFITVGFGDNTSVQISSEQITVPYCFDNAHPISVRLQRRTNRKRADLKKQISDKYEQQSVCLVKIAQQIKQQKH